ncbi:MAG: hypothetical protein GEU86_10675 [Actinophytocola sp.]|nr:hypothetical protein [Actinophytocola sp.]
MNRTGQQAGRRRAVCTDDGVATVLTAGAVAALLAVYTLLIWFGSAVIARHRAAASADLAALAAASYARDGPERACRRAGIVAERMGGTLGSCLLRGQDALVKVVVAPRGVPAAFGAATARARAGPADEPR